MITRKFNDLTYDLVATTFLGDPVYIVNLNGRLLGYLKERGTSKAWGHMRADNLMAGFTYDAHWSTGAFENLAKSDQERPVQNA